MLTEAGLRRLLAEELAAFLAIDPATVDCAKPFDEYGLDSTDAVVLVGILEEQLGTELEPELLLQNGSIDEVLQSLKARGTIA